MSDAAADLIVAAVNGWRGSGQSGYLVFERDGTGGQFYSLDVKRWVLGPIVVDIGGHHDGVPLTLADAVALISGV